MGPWLLFKPKDVSTLDITMPPAVFILRAVSRTRSCQICPRLRIMNSVEPVRQSETLLSEPENPAAVRNARVVCVPQVKKTASCCPLEEKVIQALILIRCEEGYEMTIWPEFPQGCHLGIKLRSTL